MIVVFRCNAGPKIGFGHLMRCRTLAEVLTDRGHACIMVGPSEAHAKKEDETIFVDWVPTGHWSSSIDDSNFLVDLAKKHRATWLVLDDYRVDEKYQLVLHDAGMKWLQFDGWADKILWADYVLNANPAAKPEDYALLLRNRKSKLLLGPSYALLRKDFYYVGCRPSLRAAKKVLITFGGGDDRGASEFVLSRLVPATDADINFVVVSGAANPNNKKIQSWISRYGEGRVSLHIDPLRVAPLFASCDMAVMAGGTSTYEAAVCGIPMILISIAKNQVSQSAAWDSLNSAFYLGSLDDIRSTDLVETFIDVARNDNLRYSMSLAEMSICQPGGAEKIARILDKKSDGFQE